MLSIDRDNLSDLLTALAISGALMLIATPAFSQIAVTDPPIELSVTTPGGAGRFQHQAPYLNSLMQTMASGVADAGTFANFYPGWVDFGPDAADVAAGITNRTLTTYANAITVAQSQAADFNTEDAKFQTLETCNASSIGVLQAIQC